MHLDGNMSTEDHADESELHGLYGNPVQKKPLLLDFMLKKHTCEDVKATN